MKNLHELLSMSADESDANSANTDELEEKFYEIKGGIKKRSMFYFQSNEKRNTNSENPIMISKFDRKSKIMDLKTIDMRHLGDQFDASRPFSNEDKIA